jgi:hypothetical protein
MRALHLLSAFAVSAPAVAFAQVPYQTQCRMWENGRVNSTFPCVVQFASDGYTAAIQTPYDTHYRGDSGWSLGARNKECLRSTDGGYQIAICPITNH